MRLSVNSRFRLLFTSITIFMMPTKILFNRSLLHKKNVTVSKFCIR